MPASLKFVAILLALGLAGALASGVIQHREDETQARLAAETMTGGSVDGGKAAIGRYGCGSCHMIPGIATATGRTGPSLRGMARRAIVAGRLPNDPANLIRWVQQPQHVSPGTAMPEQPMPDHDARDLAAYLYTLRK